MTFGQRLIQLREEQGYTRQQFCHKIGLPYNTYRNYEADAREPTYSLLCQIANILNVSIDYLLCRTQIRQPALQLNEEESRLILNFRRLDQRGKYTVNACTAAQLSYCENTGESQVIAVSKGSFGTAGSLRFSQNLPIAARGGIRSLSEEDQKDAQKISQAFFSQEDSSQK